jgi:copper oxidase (laccase) domain-containing protein
MRKMAEAVEKFAELEALSWLRHGFTLRQPGVETSLDREATVANLCPSFQRCVELIGGDFADLQTAEQIHGAEIAMAGNGASGKILPNLHAGVDALITNVPGQMLGILVADCCAVYLVDPVNRAIGLAHSGKKGSELGIVPGTLAAMAAAFGTEPSQVMVRLSPCIRPPAYEVDFAAKIRSQCEAAGVGSVFDDQMCTAAFPERYYSYRREKGATGRMLAIMGIAM